jgi:hypothetical protein
MLVRPCGDNWTNRSCDSPEKTKKKQKQKQKQKKKFENLTKNGQRFVTRVTSTIHMKLGPEINHVHTRNSAVFHKSRPKWTGDVF